MTVVIRRTEAEVNDTAVSELFALPNQEEELLSARDEAVASANTAKAAAGEAGATIAASYATAVALAPMLPDGAYIRVLVDSTRNNQQTIYFVDQPDNPALVVDFAADAYQTGTSVLELDFVRSVGINLVSVPTTSTSPGFVGDIAVDTTHVYFAVAVNQWKRITLESF